MRVSTRRVERPPSRSANAAVIVAMPLRRWTKFKAVRSAVKSARVGPSMRAATLPLAIVRAVGQRDVDRHRRVHQRERLGEDVHAAEHAVLLDEQHRPRSLIGGHAVVGRHVPPGDVLVERALDDRPHLMERRMRVAQAVRATADDDQ